MKLRFFSTHLILLLFLTIVCLVATGFSAFMFFDSLGGKVASGFFIAFLVLFFILMVAACYKLVDQMYMKDTWHNFGNFGESHTEIASSTRSASNSNLSKSRPPSSASGRSSRTSNSGSRAISPYPYSEQSFYENAREGARSISPTDFTTPHPSSENYVFHI